MTPQTEIMNRICEIEHEMEGVKEAFKKLDRPTITDYHDRDEKIEALLRERDALHNAYKKSSAAHAVFEVIHANRERFAVDAALEALEEARKKDSNK